MALLTAKIVLVKVCQHLLPFGIKFTIDVFAHIVFRNGSKSRVESLIKLIFNLLYVWVFSIILHVYVWQQCRCFRQCLSSNSCLIRDKFLTKLVQLIGSPLFNFHLPERMSWRDIVFTLVLASTPVSDGNGYFGLRF